MEFSRVADWETTFEKLRAELLPYDITEHEPYERPQPVADAEVEKIKVVIQQERQTLAILSRSLELQLEQEIEKLKHSKPNFSSDEQALLYANQVTFLEELATALGLLAEGIANLGTGGETVDAQELAESAQSLRDMVIKYFTENKRDAVFYCVKMPAMLGSIALFSAAGASMVSATPVLMAIFGGDRIVRLLQTAQKK